MTSIKDVLAVVRDPGNRATATARILLDGSLIERFQAADVALAEALVEHAAGMDVNDPPPPVRACMDRLDALRAKVEAAEVEFKFRAVTFREWADLLAEHPPTKEQAKNNAPYNDDELPPAAVALSCVDPEMTADDAKQLLDDLHPSQRDLLWGTCLRLNRGDVDAPKSRFLAGLGPRSSVESGEPHTTSESPVPSSSDGS